MISSNFVLVCNMMNAIFCIDLLQINICCLPSDDAQVHNDLNELRMDCPVVDIGTLKRKFLFHLILEFGLVGCACLHSVPVLRQCTALLLQHARENLFANQTQKYTYLFCVKNDGTIA